MPVPMTVLVGTSGWSYPAGYGKWKGFFYPARWGGDELAFYAERFPAVEVNSTFYRLPTPATVRGWVARTPAHFRFTAKLYKKFTHPELFARQEGQSPEITAADVQAMRGVLDALAEYDRLGAVLLQYPEGHICTAAAMAALVRTLTDFRDYPLAVEIRHASWEHDRTRELLEAHGAAFVRIDEPCFKNLDEPFAPASTLQYWRFHGRNAVEWGKRDAGLKKYDYLYSAAEVQELGASVKAHANPRGGNFTFFNNHLHSKAVVNAVELARSLDLDVPYPKFAHLADAYPELLPITGGPGGQLGLL